MAKTNNGSTVEYKGNFEGLVIKVNGAIVYSGKLKETTKSAALQKDQDDLAMVSKFASCVNHVPELSRIWRQARIRKHLTDKNKTEYTQKAKFGRNSTFNKIVSENRREISKKGRPGTQNVIAPVSDSFPYNYSAKLNKDSIEIDLNIPSDIEMRRIHENSIIIPVCIFSFFDPKKKNKSNFEMISKYYQIDNFISADRYRIQFPILPEDLIIIKNYKRFVFYFVIIEHSRNLKRVRWFRHEQGAEIAMDGFPKKGVEFGRKHKEK